MAVRIALQTSEADSQLILGDNNSAARLLSRPGEAIYNDAGGLVEANSPFQVAWLPDEKREKYLECASRKLAEAHGSRLRHEPPIVFEGNAPADVRKNAQLAAKLPAAAADGNPGGRASRGLASRSPSRTPLPSLSAARAGPTSCWSASRKSRRWRSCSRR